jgi:predicted ATP-grasp superfamily ATP-dependent carboligase
VGTDPLGYFDFVLNHLTREHYDVLLPVHEQSFLFAKMRNRLPPGVKVALADFDAFSEVQGKVAFARLMERLSLPQPLTHIIHTRAEMETLDLFPYYIKADYSTAGQGVWRVRNRKERDQVVFELGHVGLLDGTHEIVVQEEAMGALCQVQAVFTHGHLLAYHCTQTRGESVGGGHAARMGVDHPQVREHLIALGQAINWHGPLALDYLYNEATGQPSYIECNPRLVEPMNATLSGVNLAELTIRVALDEVGDTANVQSGRPGIRSHSLMAVLLGIADHAGSQRKLIHTIFQDIRGQEIFAESKEDLTPVQIDPPSLVPLLVVSGQLMLSPRSAHHIATGAVNAYSLNAQAIETITAFDEKSR